VIEENLRNSLVNLTRDLMLIQSDEQHPENKQRCLRIARYPLESLAGVELHDFVDHGCPSLVAMPRGIRTPDILMVAHLDVVTHESLDFPEPRIENDRIVGPGAGDMKGIVAICLKVFEHLHRRHPGISLGLVITTDEETGGHHGAKSLVEHLGLSGGVALIPDGGGPGELSIAEKGIVHLSLQARGRETHAARPWLGVNAVELLFENCQRIKKMVEALAPGVDSWLPTCSITGFHSPNQSINILPSHAEAMMDIRFPPPHRAEQLLAAIHGGLSEGVTVQTCISEDPGVLNPDPVYEACMKAVHGGEVRHVRNDGGSDARYFSRRGIRVNMSRPLVGNIHSREEWIDIPSMLEFYHLYLRYIGIISGGTESQVYQSPVSPA